MRRFSSLRLALRSGTERRIKICNSAEGLKVLTVGVVPRIHLAVHLIFLCVLNFRDSPESEFPCPFLGFDSLDMGLGYGTWIWDLDFGLGLGLGLVNKHKS